MGIRDLKKTKGVCTIIANISGEEITSAKSKYLRVDIKEDIDGIKFNLFNSHPKYKELKELKAPIKAEIEIEFLKTNVKGYDEYNIVSFKEIKTLSTTDCVEIEELKKELRLIINKIEDVNLKALAYELCKDKELLKKLFEAPATEKSAYSFRGGLLAHIVRLSRCAIALSEVYDMWDFNKEEVNEKINKDLLLICALFHDIGKVNYYEFEKDTVVKTVKGELFEDSYLSANILRDTMNKCSLTDEQKDLIEHCIISSKGKLNYGALATPRTKEANIFHCLERIDSMMGNFEYMQRASLGGNFQKLHEKVYCLVDFEEV